VFLNGHQSAIEDSFGVFLARFFDIWLLGTLEIRNDQRVYKSVSSIDVRINNASLFSFQVGALLFEVKNALLNVVINLIRNGVTSLLFVSNTHFKPVKLFLYLCILSKRVNSNDVNDTAALTVPVEFFISVVLLWFCELWDLISVEERLFSPRFSAHHEVVFENIIV